MAHTCTQYVRTVSLLPEPRSTPTRSSGVQPKFCCAKAAVVGSRYIVELCSGSLLRRFLRSKTSNAESSLWLTTHGTPALTESLSLRSADSLGSQIRFNSDKRLSWQKACQTGSKERLPSALRPRQSAVRCCLLYTSPSPRD